MAKLIDALEQADLDALIGLLVEDVRFSMPPASLEYQGTDLARRVLATVTFLPGRTFKVVPTRANDHPAFAMYMADPHADVYRGYSLLVISIDGDRIDAITGFQASVLPRFGLPWTLPETD